MVNEETSDAELLENIHLFRDQQSFTLLFRRHYNALYQLVISKTGDAALAEDIVQEIFVHFWENSHRLVNILSVNAYLSRIARNKIFDFYRTSQKHDDLLARLGHLLKNDAIEESTPDYLKERELKEQVFETAVEELPERIREIYTLRARTGYSYEEIAELLNIKPQSARNAYSKAVAMLYDATGNLALALLLCYLN